MKTDVYYYRLKTFDIGFGAAEISERESGKTGLVSRLEAATTVY
jgi:hypothetical protein